LGQGTPRGGGLPPRRLVERLGECGCDAAPDTGVGPNRLGLCAETGHKPKRFAPIASEPSPFPRPEPVAVHTTGRAVFVASGGGIVTWTSAPVQRYTHPRRGRGSQRSGR
jgi:hypothetical protein